MLGHPGPETLAHLEESVSTIKVSDTAPNTTQCETYSLTEAQRVVYRGSDRGEPTDKPLDR